MNNEKPKNDEEPKFEEGYQTKVTVNKFKEEMKDYIQELPRPKLVRLWNFIVDTAPQTALKALLDEKLDSEKGTE